ncbi:MAG TPA: ATP-binding protein [Steroidobacteraceae bacterium]|nr:ATP-binding protein [Steroidobacteraceae bacterium]
MKSLFLRIFLSFWFVMGLIVVSGVTLTALIAWQTVATVQAIDASDVADNALAALKKGGLSELQNWTRQIWKNENGMRTYIVDMHGVDILHRPLPDRLERRVRQMSKLGFLADSDGNPPPLIPDPLRWNPQIVGPDGAVYTVLFSYRGWSLLSVLGGPSAIWVLLAIALSVSALACWWLARYLTRPVTSLQASARALAAGNLETRVDADIARRRDELGVLAREFDQMAERLRELLASKETLLRYVSHELRSPLARLRVALSLARREGADTAREMDRIERETERLDTMIGQILRLSSLSTNDPSMLPQRVELSHLLSEVVDDARLEARAGEKTVEFRPAVQAEVLGNHELLRSAIENVIRNAIRFTEKQSKIDVGLQVQEKQAIVTIRDQGCGVPDDELQKIFEPFHRVPGSSQRDSTGGGLGLTIAARVVSVHGGKVHARNAPDKGLIVEIALPLAA